MYFRYAGVRVEEMDNWEWDKEVNYLPLAFSSVNWCKIDVFTLNIIPLHHKVSNYQQQQKYKMIKKNFWLCHDLKEILRVTNFFIIFVKYDSYNSGSGAQVLVVIDFKLHWF